jgi:hypothetical protein
LRKIDDVNGGAACGLDFHERTFAVASVADLSSARWTSSLRASTAAQIDQAEIAKMNKKQFLDDKARLFSLAK